MARVDHRYRDISRCKLSRHWKLQSPCSLQYYQSRLQRLELGDQPADTLLVIAHSPMRFTWLNGYVQLLLRYVYAHVGLLCAHPRFTPSRPVLADSGLYGPGNCSGSGRLVGVTILLGYGLHYQDPFDLSRPSVQDTRSLGQTEQRAGLFLAIPAKAGIHAAKAFLTRIRLSYIVLLPCLVFAAWLPARHPLHGLPLSREWCTRVLYWYLGMTLDGHLI